MKWLFQIAAELANPIQEALFTFVKVAVGNAKLRKALVQTAKEVGEGVRVVKEAWSVETLKNQGSFSEKDKMDLDQKLDGLMEDMEIAFQGDAEFGRNTENETYPLDASAEGNAFDN